MPFEWLHIQKLEELNSSKEERPRVELRFDNPYIVIFSARRNDLS